MGVLLSRDGEELVLHQLAQQGNQTRSPLQRQGAPRDRSRSPHAADPAIAQAPITLCNQVLATSEALSKILLERFP